MDSKDNQPSSKGDEIETSSNDFRLMHLNRMVLHISFTVPTKKISSSPLKSTLYYLFTPCVFILYTLVLTAQALGVYQYWGDLDVTMENLFLTTGFVMCYWEGAYFKMKKVEIWRIFDRLDAKPVPETSDQTLRKVHERIVNKAQSNCKKLSWFIFLSVNVGTLMWAVFPLVNLSVHGLSEDESPQETSNKPHPYLMYIIWVPYDLKAAQPYALTYLLQVIVYFTASLYNTSSNIVFINLIIHATAKFKVVEASILRMEEIMSAKGEGVRGEIGKIAGTSECTNGEEKFYGEDLVQDGDMYPRIPLGAFGDDLQLCLDTELSSNFSEVENFLVECVKQHQDAIE
jgi:7tm Odorant receptor.